MNKVLLLFVFLSSLTAWSNPKSECESHLLAQPIFSEKEDSPRSSLDFEYLLGMGRSYPWVAVALIGSNGSEISPALDSLTQKLKREEKPYIRITSPLVYSDPSAIENGQSPNQPIGESNIPEVQAYLRAHPIGQYYFFTSEFRALIPNNVTLIFDLGPSAFGLPSDSTQILYGRPQTIFNTEPPIGLIFSNLFASFYENTLKGGIAYVALHRVVYETIRSSRGTIAITDRLRVIDLGRSVP